MYKSGANNVYIKTDENGKGQWNLTSISTSENYQTITIDGTTNLYYEWEGTEYASTGNSFSLQPKNIDVSSIYSAGKAAGRQEHIDEGYVYTQTDVTNARSVGYSEGQQAHIDAGYKYTANDVSSAWSAGINQGHQDFIYVGDGAGDYVFGGGW